MTNTVPPTVASAVVASLRAAGVRRVHGVPGEDHLPLLHAIEAGGLDYIAARDESAAGIMATAESQLTGVPGVLLVTPAPGITNAINGIASAALDHVPLIVIVGQHGPDRRPIIVRQNLDNHALVAPLVKWSTTLSARVHQVMAKVLDVATLGDPGPVLVELRDDVSRLPAADEAAAWRWLGVVPPVVAPLGAAEPLRDALAGAARPILLVGGRGSAASVGGAVERLAASVRAPVLTTPSAKGTVSPGSPWLAGTFLNGNLEAELLGRADLIVGVGLDAGDVFNGPWKVATSVFALEPDATRTQGFYPTDRRLVGDLVGLLEAGSPADGSASAWTPDDVAGYRAGILAHFDDDGERITIPSGIRDARSTLPPDALVTVDAGFGKPLMSVLFEATVPGGYLSSQGLSTMGYAIPAANALKLAEPDRPVVGFLGDGSLLMRASEIGVAAEHGIAPIYVVWIDGALSQIEVKQHRQDLRPVGVRFPPPDCAAIAAAFGATGCTVETRPAFRAALTDALASDRPTVIGALVDHSRRAEWFELLRG